MMGWRGGAWENSRVEGVLSGFGGGGGGGEGVGWAGVGDLVLEDGAHG